MSSESHINRQTVTLELRVEQVNTILGALGKRPFEDVFTLIGEIQGQARAQLQEPQAAEELNQ